MTVNDEGIVTSCSRTGGNKGWQLFSVSRWSKDDGRKLKKHLETEFEEKQNHQIYWDDVAMFCYPDEYQLGINEMKVGDIIEIDNLRELAEMDKTYEKYLTKGIKPMNSEVKEQKSRIDWMITLMPLAIIVALCVVFFVAPDQSNAVLSKVRFFFGDTFGTYYLIIGLGVFLVSWYIAFSKYGNIVLGGKMDKPQYNFFAWGAMMFTCGLAADILFYSFAEWIMYASDPHIAELGSIQDWAGVFPIFHWSFIPWSFYLVLAVAFGFMLHVRKRSRQKYSEACRPILGSIRMDGGTNH